eukprot:TRINITY_DN1830_c0_g1_i1.p1 TRINITY_DN1830_c0_g1~~TRINITY_DN1830_c0_g1_i1.p1  ORF type:complete len:517 (+),score=87.07 TRINITY_DN1830_c0_g1_i1:106-1656(+)
MMLVNYGKFVLQQNNKRRISNRISIRQRRVIQARASPYASTATAAPSIDPRQWTVEERQKKFKELQALFGEIMKVSRETGTRGVFRGIQAGQAISALSLEYIQKGEIEQPQVILRKFFEKMGATYIKLGQFIASSPTLFPEQYVLEFQKCLDKTDPVPFKGIRQTIQDNLDRPMESIFSFVDPTPLASASVAQVHTAVLRDSGKDVVLKVLKPGVEDILTADLNFIYVFSKILEFINPELTRISLSAIIGDIKHSMMEEVDFRKEAANLMEFQNYLDAAGLNQVATSPFVYRQFSGKKLLTMDRLEGVPLTDLNSIRQITNKDPETILINALNTWFGSLLACETFHADVHAGNLLVLKNGKVGFIDFGIVGRISPVTWQSLQAFVGALATLDYNTMARALVTMGATDQDVDIDAFARDLEALFREVNQIDTELVLQTQQSSLGKGARIQANVLVDDAQVNRLLLQMVRIGETHGIKFPREFGLLLKQMLYFDRYTRLLAPQLQILNDSRIRIGESY